jgi:hypothetical protein
MHMTLSPHFPVFVQFVSIPPDVKMSSKNTLRYSSGTIVFKKLFHSKRGTAAIQHRLTAVL